MEKCLTYKEIAKMIDHSLLRPNMNRKDIDDGCEIAKKYDVASVCVRGYDVTYCAKKLQGTDIPVGVVVSFPHGNSSIESKVLETERTIIDGAKEIDVVLAIGMLLSGEYDYVKKDIDAVLNVCIKNNVILKVIFENAYLSKDDIIKCCEICSELGVHYVKTSTGYAPSGAKIEDVKIMREYSKPEVKIKAAGGIKTLDDFMSFYEAGARRMGATSTSSIVEEAMKSL